LDEGRTGEGSRKVPGEFVVADGEAPEAIKPFRILRKRHGTKFTWECLEIAILPV